MITDQYKIIISLVVSIVITATIVFGSRTVLSWREDSIKYRDAVKNAAVEEGVSQDGDALLYRSDSVEKSERQSADEFKTHREDAYSNDPVIRDWGSQPVPLRLRKLAREERLARERLASERVGRAGDAVEQAGEEAETKQR